MIPLPPVTNMAPEKLAKMVCPDPPRQGTGGSASDVHVRKPRMIVTVRTFDEDFDRRNDLATFFGIFNSLSKVEELVGPTTSFLAYQHKTLIVRVL